MFNDMADHAPPRRIRISDLDMAEADNLYHRCAHTWDGAPTHQLSNLPRSTP